MVVTFCGHREVSNAEDVQEWLYEKIEKLIQSGANTFVMGGYGEFDFMAASVVCELKKKYLNVKSILVLPYRNIKFDKNKYDGVLYPCMNGVSEKYAIIRCNQWMVDWSDILVAYVERNWGGAVKTLKYAEEKRKIVIQHNIMDVDLRIKNGNSKIKNNNEMR